MSKSFALVMYFDEASEAPIRKIWERIAKANLTSTLPDSGIRPHLTLSVFDEVKCMPCEDELKTFANTTKLLSLEASYIGIFIRPEPVVFLTPTPTVELINFHQQIVQTILLDEGLTKKAYRPGSWVPHCTLALDFKREALPAVIQQTIDMPLPIKLRTAQVGVVNFMPIRPLFDFDLLKI